MTMDTRLLFADYPDPPRNVRILLENHETLNVTWIAGMDNGLAQYFVVQIRNASSTEWIIANRTIGEGFDEPHWTTVNVHQLPAFVRMYAENAYGKSTFTSEMFISGGPTTELTDACKKNFQIS